MLDRCLAVVVVLAAVALQESCGSTPQHWQFGHWYGKRDPTYVSRKPDGGIMGNPEEAERFLSKLLQLAQESVTSSDTSLPGQQVPMALPPRSVTTAQRYPYSDDEVSQHGRELSTIVEGLLQSESPFWRAVAEELMKQTLLSEGSRQGTPKRSIPSASRWRRSAPRVEGTYQEPMFFK